ncbi:alpha-actinin, sarcomeric [Pelomyxa schiedti]|nr:alpha-actinin, sarcomeric [Pelomyxa schiedti]
MASGVQQEWIGLQRKLYTRWCKQKLVRRHDIVVNDIVTDIKEGTVLFALLEELTETKFPDQRLVPKPGTVKTKIKQIEAVGNALKWCFQLGVELRLKPSPEELVDGNVNAVLSLVFAMIIKFMKIESEDESQTMDARQALLMWVNNKCPELAPIDSFKKSAKSPFHNGMALCALIAKHRPRLMPEYGTLTPANAVKNIELAQEAALKYWGLEKFLTATDVTKLDENGMVVYVSEFYYGIAEQRKLDLAARRLTKLIKLTEENDKLKEQFKATAAEYKVRLKGVEATLNDQTIDNNMAGAVKRLEEFYVYKTEHKNKLLGAQLQLEGLFNSLAMRLSHHKRPEFIPPEGVTLKNVQEALEELERVEQKRSLALHAELNRQNKLVMLAKQHLSIYDNLCQWIQEKEQYLNTKEIVESVSAAQFQLKRLESYDKESENIQHTVFVAMKKLGEELETNIYEDRTTISAREHELEAKFVALGKLSEKKMPVLKDDLEREKYKQATRLMFEEHTKKFEAIQKWISDGHIYLNAREKIYSVPEAMTQISLLESFESEKITVNSTNVDEMKTLGRVIIAREHNNPPYSQWKFEHPEKIEERFAFVDSEWEVLRKESEEKNNVLKDHLKREGIREKYRITNQQHIDKYEQLSAWSSQKKNYLESWDAIHNMAEVIAEITVFNAYEQEYKTTQATHVVELTQLGDDIRSAHHGSDYSSYEFDHTITRQPEFEENNEATRKAVDEREATIKAHLEELAALAVTRKKILDDHRQREEFASKMRTVALTHAEKFAQLSSWITKSEIYLKNREVVHSVADVKKLQTLLKNFHNEKDRMFNVRVADFNKIGNEVLTKNYDTEMSSFSFDHIATKFPVYESDLKENREAVVANLKFVETKWIELAELEKRKEIILTDHYEREVYAEDTRNMANEHSHQWQKLADWVASKEEYLGKREKIESIADVSTQIAFLDAYHEEKKLVDSGEVTDLKALGEKLLQRERNTPLSTYSYEQTTYNEPVFKEGDPTHRQQIIDHEAWVDEKREALHKAYETKKKVLEDHKKREEAALATRCLAHEHEDMYNKLVLWCKAKHAFLLAREKVDSIALAQTHITLLEQYNKEFESTSKTMLVAFNELGDKIQKFEHNTDYGSYVYEHTIYKEPIYDHHEEEKKANLLSHLSDIAGNWTKLKEEEEERGRVLADHLKRETFADRLRRKDQQHLKQFNKLESWVVEKTKYLEDRPPINSIAEALAQISIFETYKKEVETVTSVNIAALNTLGNEIIPDHIDSSYSHYECENPDEIRARHSKMTQHLEALAGMAETLKRDLKQSLELEEEKERLRLEYAHLALQFTLDVAESAKSLAIETFGFTLEEVQDYSQKVTESKSRLLSEADKKVAQIKAVKTNMDTIKVTENIYSQLELKDIDATLSTLSKAIEARDSRHAKELERQIFNDNLCLQFSQLAGPFSTYIITSKDTITASRGELEAQLEFVTAQLAGIPKESARLTPIRELAERMKLAGITNIRHTTLTLKDVEVQWEQFTEFLKAKKEMLIAEIEHSKLRGITPQQFQEIEVNFRKFDKDSNGLLDRKEFMMCLYSLGEEKTSKEVTALMTEYGTNGNIPYDRFKDFMVRLLGDSDTKAEILESLALINKSNNEATHAAMEQVVADYDIAYFEKTAPPSPKGWDFALWVEAMFSR